MSWNRNSNLVGLLANIGLFKVLIFKRKNIQKKYKNIGYPLKFLFLCGLKFFTKIYSNMSNIAEKVTKIIVDKLGVDESEVTNEASFTNDLGADSLDTVELIMEFEKEFDISIPDEQAENIQTVGDAVTYLEAQTK